MSDDEKLARALADEPEYVGGFAQVAGLLRAEVLRLRRLNCSLADRVAEQSELLSRRAEARSVEPRCEGAD